MDEANDLEATTTRQTDDIRRLLGRMVRTKRTEIGISQAALGRALKTSQAQVARIESAAPGVTADAAIRALCVLGLLEAGNPMPLARRRKPPTGASTPVGNPLRERLLAALNAGRVDERKLPGRG